MSVEPSFELINPSDPFTFKARSLEFPGMTLRDYFAAQALVGILACFRDHENADTVQTRVGKAYEYADAMLRARDSE